jgi:hypothetical protein
VSPSSKAASETIARVHRLSSGVSELPRRAVEHLRELLGALFVESVAGPLRARGLGLEGEKAPPVEVVDGLAHRLRGASEVLKAIFGARSPLEKARSICDRRMVKVSLERRPFWRLSRSSSDNGRTKIGVFMGVTVTRYPKPILKTH